MLGVVRAPTNATPREVGGTAGKFEHNTTLIYLCSSAFVVSSTVYRFTAPHRYYALLIIVCVILFISRGTGGVNEPSIRKRDKNDYGHRITKDGPILIRSADYQDLIIFHLVAAILSC